MKVVLACVLLALASAMAPPKISLELDGAAKLPKPVYRKHDLGLTQPNGDSVKSRQDYAETCPANNADPAKAYWGKDCKLPKAKAFDANDKSVEVKARYFLVDKEGKAQSVKRVLSRKDLVQRGFKSRSTWLIKYDAKDTAGNHAEQVVFALVFDDKTKPKFVYSAFTTVEAATQGFTLPRVTAIDNIDSSAKVTKAIRYTIEAMPAKENSLEAPNKVLPTKPFTLRKNAPVQSARYAIDTDVTGKYLVKFQTSDMAGVYGKNSKNNKAVATEAINVVDTTRPVLHVHGTTPYKVECSYKTYNDWGAHAYDSLDTARLGRKLRVFSKSNVNLKKTGKYTVKYNTKDAAGNRAKTAVRRVVVVDTKKPNIKLNGAALVTHLAGKKYSDAGVQVYDACPEHDGAKGFFGNPKNKALKTTKRWNQKLNTNVPGVYKLTYTTCENRKGGKCASITRQVVVEDAGTPILALKGQSVEYYEASRDLVYTDKGAKCHDGVEGDISHAVEVSGEVVNMKRPATYPLRYDCQDNRGNQAEPLFRKVVIRDTTCPQVTLKGPAKAYVEAGFHYKDAGATATDTLDGDITKKIQADGNTVDTKMAFMNYKSCYDIRRQYKSAKSGDYMITMWNKKSLKVERISVWCDMYSLVPATYHRPNQQENVKSFSFNKFGRNTGSCPAGSKPFTGKLSKWAKKRFIRNYGKAFYLGNNGKTYKTDTYVCKFFAGKWNNFKLAKVTAQKTRKAETGKYVIRFYVNDKAGNDQCHTRKRTVIVKDTLPPVISLKYGKHQFHKSYPKGRGINGEVNPAIKYQNKLFMAETSSVNGWMFAAVASAVAGVALLSLSTKQNHVPVPV